MANSQASRNLRSVASAVGIASLLAGLLVVLPIAVAPAHADPVTEVSLSSDKATFDAGEVFTLTAIVDEPLEDTSSTLTITDTTNSVDVKVCTTGVECEVDLSFLSGGPREYTATVNSLTSNTVEVARTTWTIELEADDLELHAGETTSLHATTNQDLSDTSGTFEVYIFDSATDELIESCDTDVTCSVETSAIYSIRYDDYRSYVAYVAAAGSPESVEDLVSIEATSDAVEVGPVSWDLSMSSTASDLEPGETATVTLTSANDVGETSGQYELYLFNTKNMSFLASCDTGLTCEADVSWSDVEREGFGSYILGAVAAASAVDPEYFSDVEGMRWGASISIGVPEWTLDASVSEPAIAAGESTTIQGVTNLDVGDTDGRYSTYIVEYITGKIFKECTEGTECSLEYSFYGDEDQATVAGGCCYTDRNFGIIVGAAGATDLYSITNMRAVEFSMYVERVDWAISLYQTGANSFTLTSNQDVGQTEGHLAYYLFENSTGALAAHCEVGTRCVLSSSISAPHGYTATVQRLTDPLPADIDHFDPWSQMMAWATTYNAPSAPTGPLLPGESRGGSNPAEKFCQCSHADPVNTYDGEYFENVLDVTIPGVGPSFGIARTYSSEAAQADGPFGHGWAANFDVAIGEVMSGDVLHPLALQVEVRQENGSTLLFTRNDFDEYETVDRINAELEWDDTHDEWILTRNVTETLTFDSSGALSTVEDLNGNTITYTRDGSGHVTDIAASGGREFTLSWTDGRVSSIVDSASRSVAYTYDVAGDLTSVVAADGAVSTYSYTDHRVSTVTRPGGGIVSNTYDSYGRVTAQEDEIGRFTTFSYSTPPEYASSSQTTTTTTPDGASVSEHYVRGLMVSQTRAVGEAEESTSTFTYDGANNLATSTSPGGAVTTFTYDGAGNKLTQTDDLAQTTTWTYNAFNEATSVTDPLNRETVATYDGDGNLTSTTSPGGRVTEFTYNGDGTAATMVDPRGKTTTFSYDGAGRLASTTDPDSREQTVTYDDAGFISSTTDAGGNTTSYTTDEVGRVLTVTDALSHLTTYAYDDDGNLLSTEDANNDTTSSAYDLAGQVTSTTDGRGKTTTFTYTDGGYLATVTDPDSRTTTRTYDRLGRVVSIADPDSNTTAYAYDLDGHPLSVTLPSTAVSTATYDTVGQRLTTTDGNGKTTTYAYDAAGQLMSVTDPLSRVTSTSYTDDGQVDTVTLADSSTQLYEYNANGQVVSFTDADGNVTTYSYDDAGLLISKTAPGSVTTQYSYDDAGRLEITTLPDSTTVTNNYDDASRLSLQEFSASGAADIEFDYDAVGRRTAMTDASGSSSYSYNANGQLTSETNGASQTLTYSHTDSGLLASITYPGSRTVEYSYNSAGRLGSVTDWNSNETDFAWTVDGQLASQTSPNGVTQTRTYDSAGQTTDLTAVGSISTLAQYGYGYDDAGQLVSDSTTDPILSAVAHTYTYDALNQVLSSDDGTTEVGYEPTPAGQLVAMGDDTLAYDSAQRLTDLTPGSGPATSFSYDDNGSRTNATIAASSPDPAQSTDYTYDAALNLATVTLPGDPSPTVSYTSNGDGLRQTRTEASTTDEFLWSTARGLPLLLDDETSTYIYGPSSTPIAQIDGSDAITYLFGDLLGSVRLITDETGAVVGTTEYDTYGNRSDHTGTTDSLIGYTGNWTDPTTELVYLRARDYEPSTGQFLTVDPAVGQTRQPYAYAQNNPLLLLDPSGLSADPPPPSVNSTTPWELGFQWITGTGPRVQHFNEGDPFTELLRTHANLIEDGRKAAGILGDGYTLGEPLIGSFNYSLGGIDGVGKYVSDYSTLATAGNTGNLAATYLGSYNVTITPTQTFGAHCVELTFSVRNNSTFASATHLPLYGLIPGYSGFESWENSLFPSGPLSKTTQVITWTQNVMVH